MANFVRKRKPSNLVKTFHYSWGVCWTMVARAYSYHLQKREYATFETHSLVFAGWTDGYLYIQTKEPYFSELKDNKLFNIPGSPSLSPHFPLINNPCA